MQCLCARAWVVQWNTLCSMAQASSSSLKELFSPTVWNATAANNHQHHSQDPPWEVLWASPTWAFVHGVLDEAARPLWCFLCCKFRQELFQIWGKKKKKKAWERERVALMENPGSLMAQQWDKRLQPHSHIQRSSLIFTLSHSKGLWFQPPTIRNAIELPVERNSIVLIVGYFQ